MNFSPLITILATRLFCRRTTRPGQAQTGDGSVGSMYYVDPLLKDFVTYCTQTGPFNECATWNPGQISHKIIARNQLEFLLPVSLRGFCEDLKPFMYGPQMQSVTLSPINPEDFDSRGRRRATFLSGGSRAMILRETDSSKWVRAWGYDSLSDMAIQRKNECTEWLTQVRWVGVPTKVVSSEELQWLIDTVGDGGWVKGITVGVDSRWLDR